LKYTRWKQMHVHLTMFKTIYLTIDSKVFLIAWAIAQVLHIPTCDEKCKNCCHP
jgi:hypothetical protein